MTQPPLRVVPLTLRVASEYVTRLHRHHGPPPVSLVHFCIGAVRCDTSDLIGAAVVGRPANRNSDDGQTAEVLRVATDGTANACSALYGAAARVAREMGFARIITYTLEVETGSSLRGAGWTLEAEGIESWWARFPAKNASDRRTVADREHYGISKLRWAVNMRPPIEYDALPAPAPAEADLFTVETA